MLLTPYPSLEETVFLADMALSAIAEVAEEIVDVLHCLCSLGDPLIELFRCQRHIQASK